jgi:carbon-monoxide dehydrogenase medium subunit
MLLNLREYHRPALAADPPAALQQALHLLARPNIRTVPLAGGSHLLASGDMTIEAVVDLQGLGLDAIHYDEQTGVLSIGAMTTRTALAEDPHAQRLCSGLLSRAAGRWSGNVQRNRATAGGAVVVADPVDPLYLALLAADAIIVIVERAGIRRAPLSGMSRPPGLISGIELSLSPGLRGGLAEVGRTPSDAPIVAACAVLEVANGKCTRAGLALGGLAGGALASPEAAQTLVGRPMTREAIARAAAQAVQGIVPQADYKGSSEYRRAMGEALARRALAQAAAPIE